MSRWECGEIWAPAEDAKLVELVNAGVRPFQLQQYFPHRTVAACKSRHNRLFPSEGRESDKVAKASKKLAAAIKALLARMPEDQVAEALGRTRAAIPGTERVRKTAEMMGELNTVFQLSEAA